MAAKAVESIVLSRTISEQCAGQFLGLWWAVLRDEVFPTPEKGCRLKSTDQLHKITRHARTILDATDAL